MILLFQVDAFADLPFTGNPAAVCILEAPASDRWMQDFAAEMNLSETAFLLRESEAFRLRWCTPKLEVDLCGHATLAAAHSLWEAGIVKGDTIRFFTRSGELSAARHSDRIELDLPIKPQASCEPPPCLLEGLGIAESDAVYVGRNEFDFIVEASSEELVRGLSPDFERVKHAGARGVMVTSRSVDARFDFISRYFAPGAGIDEDPVTGSAHVCLGPYWQQRLGKETFTAFQASDRGGMIQVRVAGDRVYLGGNAVTVFRGQLTISPQSSDSEP